jgi:hypothetical protein
VRAIPWPPLDVPALAGPAGACAAVVLFGALAIVLRRATGAGWVELLSGALLAGLFLVGALAVAALLRLAAQPRMARRTLAALAVLGAASAVFWTVHTTLVTDAGLTVGVGLGLTRAAVSYPLDWFFLFAAQFPALSALMAAAFIAAVYTRAPAWRLAVGLASFLLAAFGLLAIVPHDRYAVLLLPFALLPAAAGVELAGRLAHSLCVSAGVPALARTGAALVISTVVVVMALEQRASAGQPAGETTRLSSAAAPDAFAPQTYFADGSTRDCLRAVPATDVLVCNDELACLFLARRADAWLLPDPGIRRVCAVEHGGVARGMYTASEVLPDRDALARLIAASGDRAVTVASLATPKFGYPEQVAIAEELARAAGGPLQPCGSEGRIVRFVR